MALYRVPKMGKEKVGWHMEGKGCSRDVARGEGLRSEHFRSVLLKDVIVVFRDMVYPRAEQKVEVIIKPIRNKHLHGLVAI
jgi:hypothetical protein